MLSKKTTLISIAVLLFALSYWAFSWNRLRTMDPESLLQRMGQQKSVPITKLILGDSPNRIEITGDDLKYIANRIRSENILDQPKHANIGGQFSFTNYRAVWVHCYVSQSEFGFHAIEPNPGFKMARITNLVSLNGAPDSLQSKIHRLLNPTGSVK